MGEWDFLSGLFDSLQAHSPMLGRFWLLLMLVFRMLILGTVATDLFNDEQGEFTCNTLQPGCKQVCYDVAFPISMYRFWVFHIVLISTPSLLFLMYAMHQRAKTKGSDASICASSHEGREELHMKRLYLVNVAFRLVAEVGVLVGQWWLYGFEVEARFPCSRFPCPYTVDCFTSRPAEKTIFLCFYFVVGVVSAISSFVELCYASLKWFCPSEPYVHQNLRSVRREEEAEKEKYAMQPRGRSMSAGVPSRAKPNWCSVRSSGARKSSNFGRKSCSCHGSRTLVV